MVEPFGRKHPIHQPVYERFNTPIIIFVTVCTKDRKPVLANAEMHEILRESWQRTERWFVGRYLIMPDHIHLFCAPLVSVPESLQSWMGFWKATATRRWPHRGDLPIWQRHFWDTQLRRGESYSAKWDYVVANPVRAGLVSKSEDWPYQGEMNVLTW
jgi:REP element-mobilizing transposase RayT